MRRRGNYGYFWISRGVTSKLDRANGERWSEMAEIAGYFPLAPLARGRAKLEGYFTKNKNREIGVLAIQAYLGRFRRKTDFSIETGEGGG